MPKTSKRKDSLNFGPKNNKMIISHKPVELITLGKSKIIIKMNLNDEPSQFDEDKMSKL